MGSGDKLRFTFEPKVFCIGFAIINKGEHRLSVYVNLAWWTLYMGFGKGYDE